MGAFALSLATALPGAGTLAALAAGAIVVIALLAWLMRSHRDAFVLLTVAVLPFRVPISADGRTVNLLVPLYLVVCAGVVAHLLPRLVVLAREHREGIARDDVPASTPAALRTLRFWASPRGLELLLLGAVCLYALQSAYSDDPAKAGENLAFFYVPFGLLFVLLIEVRWTRPLLMRCLVVLVVLAIVLAGVGFVEYARKSLFLNPRVVAANEYDTYFRVNSVFFDPSIYGRFLALVMTALATVVLWSRSRRVVAWGALALAWLLGGLVTSFSQSSLAALLLGLAVLAAWRWNVRDTVYVSVGLVVLALAVLLAAPASLHFGLKGSGGSANNATNGRANLIEGGLELFARRPLYGYGSGSFEKRYKAERHTDAENATSASHTIPITIAAEQGLIGLAVYLAVLASAFAVLFGGAGRSPPRIAVAACFAALVLHTWTYADFLEDPFTWTLLALGVALARAQTRTEEAVTTPVPAPSPPRAPAALGGSPG